MIQSMIVYNHRHEQEGSCSTSQKEGSCKNNKNSVNFSATNANIPHIVDKTIGIISPKTEWNINLSLIHKNYLK